jgi:hypothetical protein
VGRNANNNDCPTGKNGHEWKNVGGKRLEPRRWFFGWKKVWRSARCCGAPMAQMNEMQMRRCEKCTSWEETATNECIALCSVCGGRRIHPDA